MAMVGPPGAGKTMLAERLPGLLPPLGVDDALQVTAVHSVLGALGSGEDGRSPLLTHPPFVAPHHGASMASVIGGGSGRIRPGAISRAHRGVLFLDESRQPHTSVRRSRKCEVVRPMTFGRFRIRTVAYSNDGASHRPPGRPRDSARESEILQVVLAVMGELGVEGVTFEEVARRARASKRTLYRRWTTKQEMVVAAIKEGPASGSRPAPIDTGSLRGDLLALLERLESMMAAGEPISLTIMQAGLRDPDLCDFIEESAGPTGARLPTAIFQAAIARGELPERADPFAYEEVAAATLVIRKLNGLTTDASYRAALVDAILIPALRSGVPAGQHGIFSGKPKPSPSQPTENRTI